MSRLGSPIPFGLVSWEGERPSNTPVSQRRRAPAGGGTLRPRGESTNNAGRHAGGIRRRGRTTCRLAWAALVGAVVLGAAGCAKPLLSPTEPRSQYSRYDLVRGQFAPQYIEDEFGRRLPNLRGRLLLPD